jgi:predicted MFS family arabinose efflux permease
VERRVRGGPAIGGFLLARHLDILFIGDALTALAALCIVMLFVPEPRRTGTPPAAPSEAPEKGSIVSVLLRRPILIMFSLVMLGYSIAYTQWGFLLPIHLSRLFSESGVRAFGILAGINGLTVIVFNPIMTLLFKRTPHERTIFIAGLLYAAGFGLFALVTSMPLFFLLAFVFTLGEIASAIAAMPFIMSRTPISHRGRMAGASQLIMGMGNALGPVVVGWALVSVSIPMVWAGIGILALISSILMLAISRTRR